MSNLREAAQQALEFIKVTNARSEFWLVPGSNLNKTVNALRAALEQPEQPVQEPVAWMVYTQDGKSVCVTDNPADFIAWRSFPLYTHPPRREWRSLSEEEILPLYSEPSSDAEMVEFARAIEAALKEKNT